VADRREERFDKLQVPLERSSEIIEVVLYSAHSEGLDMGEIANRSPEAVGGPISGCSEGACRRSIAPAARTTGEEG